AQGRADRTELRVATGRYDRCPVKGPAGEKHDKNTHNPVGVAGIRHEYLRVRARQLPAPARKSSSGAGLRPECAGAEPGKSASHWAGRARPRTEGGQS